MSEVESRIDEVKKELSELSDKMSKRLDYLKWQIIIATLILVLIILI